MTARGHLTALPSPADERRAWNRRAAALELPPEIGGTRITWEPWAPPLPITHIPGDCHLCGVDDPARAVGVVTYRTGSGKPRPIRRVFATGCLACGVVVVDDWYPDGPNVLAPPAMTEVWSNRGQGELPFEEAAHE